MYVKECWMFECANVINGSWHPSCQKWMAEVTGSV